MVVVVAEGVAGPGPSVRSIPTMQFKSGRLMNWAERRAGEGGRTAYNHPVREVGARPWGRVGRGKGANSASTVNDTSLVARRAAIGGIDSRGRIRIHASGSPTKDAGRPFLRLMVAGADSLRLAVRPHVFVEQNVVGGGYRGGRRLIAGRAAASLNKLETFLRPEKRDSQRDVGGGEEEQVEE
jgi:hypothetical protein